MRTLVIEDMSKDFPAGSRDKSLRFHKTDNLPLWEAGDIILDSIDWSKRRFIFAESIEDRADD